MKHYFLLLTLLCLSLSARAHDAEVDGIFYNLDTANRTATVTFMGDDPYLNDEYSGYVKIPETVTYKGITYSVTSVGSHCFSDCRSLTSITIPNSVTSLGDYCFSDCRSLTSITIPNSVTSLGEWCFSRCSSLTSITIPNSVTSLGDCCFWDCSSLTAITIPNSVTSLGQFCFYGCSSIERMVVDAANPVYDSREDCNAIIHTSTNELIAGCKNSQIPNSVTSLGDACFCDCSSLTSITIPNSVTSLGSSCFFGCSSLTSITIPNSVTNLGDKCFYGCSSLTSITIPNSVTSLGDDCFAFCSSLASITIPNSVTSLGGSCFFGCSSLTSIYMSRSTPPSTGDWIFYNTPLKTVYVVDEDAKKAYQAQAPWNEYEIVVMPTGIEEVETDKTAPTIVGCYDLNGKLINGKQRGTVIVRYSEGQRDRSVCSPCRVNVPVSLPQARWAFSPFAAPAAASKAHSTWMQTLIHSAASNERLCFLRTYMAHAVAALKQAASPPRNRHHTTHAQAFASSAHRTMIRQKILDRGFKFPYSPTQCAPIPIDLGL